LPNAKQVILIHWHMGPRYVGVHMSGTQSHLGQTQVIRTASWLTILLTLGYMYPDE
jgi:hypothetical protein